MKTNISTGWVCIRKATDEDRAAIEASARRFITRHPEAFNLGKISQMVASGHASWTSALEDGLDDLSHQPYYGNDRFAARLLRLWHRCIGRAVHEPSATGIGWDYIGRYEGE